MALLTDEQLHEIREIIRDHHSAFVVNTVGPEAVTPEILTKLKARGLVSTKVTSIEDAYLYGQALAMADDPKVAGMSYDDFKAWLKKNPVPLSPVETRAIEFAKHQAAQYVVGLGNKIDTTTGQMLIDADRELERKKRETIRTATAENIAKRQSIGKLVSDLRWQTKDWARDWHRIAVTEKHNAMQRGVADHFGKRYGGDTIVFKRPTPDACEHCKRLHLGPDGQPRLFKLNDLERNGSNFGRKARDWLPTIGSVHPHCQCQLQRMPAGWGFNEDGEMAPGGELGAMYESREDFQLALVQEDDLYKALKLQGHVEFQGIPIAIENRKGTTRRWTDATGEQGQTKMAFPYGYIKRTNGADEDEIDCYVGPDPRSPTAFVVHQLDPATGVYDEDKILIGFGSQVQAHAAWAWHHTQAELAFGGMTPMTIDQLKRWVGSTEPQVGEMLRKGDRFIIPLRKAIEAVPKGLSVGTISGTVAPEMGAQTSPAAYRSPGHGTFPNWMAGVGREAPARTMKELQGYDPNKKEKAQIEHERKVKTIPQEVFEDPYGAGHVREPTHEIEIHDPSFFRRDEEGNLDYGMIPEEEQEKLKEYEKKNRGKRNYTVPGGDLN